MIFFISFLITPKNKFFCVLKNTWYFMQSSSILLHKLYNQYCYNIEAKRDRQWFQSSVLGSTTDSNIWGSIVIEIKRV